MRGYGPDLPAAPADVLAGLLRAFGLEGAGIPPELADRSARFRSLVDGRRLLLVLDNARTAEQVRPLLPGSSSVLTLVTSRDSLAGLVARDGADRISLDRLPAGDAATLLREVTGDQVAGVPDAVAALVEWCARLPLALRVAGELVRSRYGSGVAELVDELADEQSRLDLLDSGGDARSAVRAVFSWSYRNLPAPAARLFRLCGLHPGHDLDPYAAAALAGDELRPTRRLLELLLRAHLVEPTPGGRLYQHDLLRSYAAELAAETDGQATRDAALTRLFDYYLHTAATAMDLVAPHAARLRPMITVAVGETPALTTYAEAMRWLDGERDNLLRVARLGREFGWPRYPAAFSGVLWRYLDMGGYFDEALALHTAGRAAARELADQVAEGNSLRALGFTNRQLGHTRIAIEQTTEALHIYRAAGEPTMQALALNNLAGEAYLDGRYRDTVRMLAEVLAIHAESGEVALRAEPLNNLGTALVLLGEFDRARDYFTDAHEVAGRTGNRMLRSGALLGLSECLVAAGRHADALDAARQALALARESGNRAPEAESLSQLGVVHRMLGEFAHSLHHHQESVAAIRAMGRTPLSVEVLNRYAETQLAAGAPADALHTLDEAIDIATGTGQRHMLTRARASTGDAHAALGRPGLARDYWRQALATFLELDLPETADLTTKLAR